MVATLGRIVAAVAPRGRSSRPPSSSSARSSSARERLLGDRRGRRRRRVMTAARGFIGAPRSGAGKTTVTLGAAARARAPRPCGARRPSPAPTISIPPSTPRRPAATSVNLDSWAMPPALLDALAARGGARRRPARDRRRDGPVRRHPGRSRAARRGRRSRRALSACRCCWCSTCPASRRSAAAVARGLRRATIRRCGSPASCSTASAASATAAGRPTRSQALGMPVLGAIPRDAVARSARAPSRPRAGRASMRISPPTSTGSADLAERHLDLDAIIDAGRAARAGGQRDAAAPLPPPGQRIALAQDAAFTFVYPHVLAGWRRAGAEIVPFSPLADEAPPDHCDVCWLPGGYPELHAGRARGGGALSRRACALRRDDGRCMASAAATWCSAKGWRTPTASATRWPGCSGTRPASPSASCISATAQARLVADTPLGPAGRAVRGHEFHYASLVDCRRRRAARRARRRPGPRRSDTSGGRRGRVTGTFFHAIAHAPPG